MAGHLTGHFFARRLDTPYQWRRRLAPDLCPKAKPLRGRRLISPVNGPARIRYGNDWPVRRAVALLNNFELSCGDPVTRGGGWTTIDTPLSVDAGGRTITFRQRADRPQLLPLVKAGILHSTSLVEIAFDTRDSESDDNLLAFSADVAALCTFAAGTGVSVAISAPNTATLLATYQVRLDANGTRLAHS